MNAMLQLFHVEHSKLIRPKPRYLSKLSGRKALSKNLKNSFLQTTQEVLFHRALLPYTIVLLLIEPDKNNNQHLQY